MNQWIPFLKEYFEKVNTTFNLDKNSDILWIETVFADLTMSTAIEVNQDTFHIYVYLPVKISQKRFRPIVELCARINSRLPVGTFNFYYDYQEVGFHYSHYLINYDCEREDVIHLFETSLKRIGVLIADSAESFMKVAKNNMSALHGMAILEEKIRISKKISQIPSELIEQRQITEN